MSDIDDRLSQYRVTKLTPVSDDRAGEPPGDEREGAWRDLLREVDVDLRIERILDDNEHGGMHEQLAGLAEVISLCDYRAAQAGAGADTKS